MLIIPDFYHCITLYRLDVYQSFFSESVVRTFFKKYIVLIQYTYTWVLCKIECILNYCFAPSLYSSFSE